MFGMALTRPRHWQCNRSMSGMDVFTQMCRQKADTSSNYCDNIQPHDKRRFSFCQMCHDFLLFFFLEITTISYFWISQGSAETCWKYGGKYYMGFAGNLLGFPAVKEFWKSVKNWQSYCHEFGVQYFLNSHRRSQYGLHLVCVMYPIIQAIWVDNRGQLG